MLVARILRASTARQPARVRTLFAVLLAGIMIAVSGMSASAGDTAVASAVPATGHANLLYGVGLVVGLPGTGDSVVDQELVDRSIVGVLKRAGIEPWRGAIAPGRIAAVTLSAELPEGATDGVKVEVHLTPIGNARSLSGGTLLIAPLHGADGVVYALGQGSVESGTATLAAALATADASVRPQARLAHDAVIQRQLIAAAPTPLTGTLAQN